MDHQFNDLGGNCLWPIASRSVKLLLYLIPMSCLALMVASCVATTTRSASDPVPEVVHKYQIPTDDPAEDGIQLFADEHAVFRYRLQEKHLDPNEGFTSEWDSEVESRTREISIELADFLRSLNDGESTFEIRFSCQVCRSDTEFDQYEVLHYSNGASDPVAFEFTPVNDYPRQTYYRNFKIDPGIEIQIMRDGIVFDRIQIPIDVKERESAKSAGLMERPFSDVEWEKLRGHFVGVPLFDEGPVLAALQSDESALSPPQEASPGLSDVERDAKRRAGAALPHVYLDFEQNLNAVSARLTIHDPQLAAQITAPEGVDVSELDNGDRVYRFSTGLRDIPAVNKRVTDFYLLLSCLTASTDIGPTEGAAFRQEVVSIYRTSCADPVAKGATWNFDRMKAVDGPKLQKIGHSLYVSLFGAVDAPFHHVFSQIIDYAKARRNSQPVRMTFGRKVHLPLQMLHPSPTFDGDDPEFLGLIFEIGNHVGEDIPQVSDDDFPAFTLPKQVVYGGYRGNEARPSDFDTIIATFSTILHGAIRRLLTANGSNVSGVNRSSDDFLNALQAAQATNDLIMVYAHGDGRGWSNATEYVGVSGQSRLIFGWDANGRLDSLAPEALIMFQSSFGTSFPNRPLVMLIACETGIASLGGTANSSFEEYLFPLGARGVLTTEAEIDSTTAQLFAERLINAMVQRPNVGPSRLVFDVRRQYVEDNHNLLPLLFNYQGGLGLYPSD